VKQRVTFGPDRVFYFQPLDEDMEAPGAQDQQDQPPFVNVSELEKAIQAWKQGLAKLLEPAGSSGDVPRPAITSADISRLNPVPPAITKLYGGAELLLAANLFWEGPGGSRLSMDPELHKKLCATSADEPDQPPLSPGASGSTSNSSPAGHLQQQQQQPLSPAAAAAAAANIQA
jgi:hypothetical protein